MTTLNREAWLEAAVEELRPLFQGINKPLDKVRVSVGWPSSGGLGKRRRVIGQCWSGETTKDTLPQLFISPLLDDPNDPMGVLATLVHELVHVVAGVDAKHGPKFARIAKQLGLEGKPTSTHGGDALMDRLKQITEKLGPFPHTKIVPPEKEKKQGTRMKKCECEACGYIARTVKKWLEEKGTPLCPCNSQPMKLELLPDEDPEGDE